MSWVDSGHCRHGIFSEKRLVSVVLHQQERIQEGGDGDETRLVNVYSLLMFASWKIAK